MTGVLADWVRAICGAAVLCSAAMSLCPEGRVKRVLRLVCGLVMTCALLSPVLEIDLDAYSSAISGYGEAARAAAEGAQAEARELNRAVIEEECAAYILDKAGELGAEVTVRVETRTGGDGVPVPWSAELTGAQSEALASALETELGIPAERQVWHEREAEN